MTLKNVETLENNTAKLTIEVPAEEVSKAIDNAYKKQKSKISIPGFRKGKVPKKMVEKMYGPAVFYEDAINFMLPEAYSDAAKESKLEIVAQPDIDVVQIEEGKEFIFTATVVLKPEVKLGEYKGVEVTKREVKVMAADVNAELDKVREQNARMISVDDRAVKKNDIIKLDFEGFVDGKAFEGGKATDYPLTIGSGAFIPGFEDQLIGAKLNEETEINVTFPEDYQAKELAGKAAKFVCTVKEIQVKELPALDDEFAQDVSEFDTLKEYKADIKKKLTEERKKAAETEKENEAIDKAVENAEMDVPQKMIEAQARNMVNDFAQRLQSQGLSMDQYMQYTGMNVDQMMVQMQPQALKKIQSRLVLEAIAKDQKIEVSDEDVQAEIKKMAEMYKMEEDKLNEIIGEEEKENMKLDIAVQRAAEFVTKNAVEVKKEEKKEEAEKADK